VAGRAWAQHQELLDRQIESLGIAAIDALAPTKGEHILDIGWVAVKARWLLLTGWGLPAP
jgi:hypothetical protein